METRIGRGSDTSYEIPEKYGRLVAFQFELESSVVDRIPYLHDDFEIASSKIVPWVPCAHDDVIKLLDKNLHNEF